MNHDRIALRLVLLSLAAALPVAGACSGTGPGSGETAGQLDDALDLTKTYEIVSVRGFPGDGLPA